MEEIRKRFIERIKSVVERYYSSDLGYWNLSIYDNENQEIELNDDDNIRLLISELESAIRDWHFM